MHPTGVFIHSNPAHSENMQEKEKQNKVASTDAKKKKKKAPNGKRLA